VPTTATAEDVPPGRGPACHACGSHRLRRPHSRNGWERFLRKYTRWDRYACPDCGDRGWVRSAVPEGADPLEALAPPRTPLPGGRPIEVRDLRAEREARRALLTSIALAVLLGVVAALYLQRCGAAPPTAE
jgi:hypothetical protein